MERLYPQDIDLHTLSPLALAFVGDGVYSLMVRERLLDGSGVIDALRAAGCGEGDTVSIYDFEFDFIV